METTYERKNVVVLLSALSAVFALNVGCGPMDEAETCREAPSTEIQESTTWSGCIRVSDDLKVKNDGFLTLEPGTRLEFAQDTTMFALDGGRLKAVGTEDEPIVLTGQEEIPSYWKGVQFNGTNSTDNKLEHVVVEYGGGKTGGYSGSKAAAIDLNNWSGDVRVAIDNTTIRHTEVYGIRIGDATTVSSFDGNTITKNNAGALVSPHGAGQLSGNSSFEGNEKSRIEVQGGEVTKAVEWPAIDGADYLVKDNLKVKGNGDASGHLTLGAGATVQFDQQAGVIAAEGGKLTAKGTSDDKIVFTGKEKTQGYWAGIQYNGTNSTDNLLNNVTIEYGGGSDWSNWSGSDPGNLVLNSWSGDVRVELKNATLRGSGGPAIQIKNNRGGGNELVGCSNVTFEDNAGSDVAPEEASCPHP